MSNRFKASICAVLAFLLTFGCSSSPVFAADREARTISIFQVEGSPVKMTKGTAKEFDAKAGLKLSDGHTVSTGKDAYCYLKLDSETVVKMDQQSKVSVSKSSSKKLSLSVQSGAALVDAAPQAEGQSIETRMGNTALTIRGTVFVVNYDDNDQVVITMLSGSGEVNGQLLPAGATMFVYDDNAIGERVYELQTLSVDAGLDLFTLLVILEYQDMLIESNVITANDIEKIPELVDTKIKEAEAAEQTAKEAEAELSSTTSEYTDQTPVTTSSDSSPDSSSNNRPKSSPTPTPEPTPTTEPKPTPVPTPTPELTPIPEPTPEPTTEPTPTPKPTPTPEPTPTPPTGDVMINGFELDQAIAIAPRNINLYFTVKDDAFDPDLYRVIYESDIHISGNNFTGTAHAINMQSVGFDWGYDEIDGTPFTHYRYMALLELVDGEFTSEQNYTLTLTYGDYSDSLSFNWYPDSTAALTAADVTIKYLGNEHLYVEYNDPVSSSSEITRFATIKTDTDSAYQLIDLVDYYMDNFDTHNASIFGYKENLQQGSQYTLTLYLGDYTPYTLTFDPANLSPSPSPSPMPNFLVEKLDSHLISITAIDTIGASILMDRLEARLIHSENESGLATTYRWLSFTADPENSTALFRAHNPLGFDEAYATLEMFFYDYTPLILPLSSVDVSSPQRVSVGSVEAIDSSTILLTDLDDMGTGTATITMIDDYVNFNNEYLIFSDQVTVSGGQCEVIIPDYTMYDGRGYYIRISILGYDAPAYVYFVYNDTDETEPDEPPIEIDPNSLFMFTEDSVPEATDDDGDVLSDVDADVNVDVDSDVDADVDVDVNVDVDADVNADVDVDADVNVDVDADVDAEDDKEDMDVDVDANSDMDDAQSESITPPQDHEETIEDGENAS